MFENEWISTKNWHFMFSLKLDQTWIIFQARKLLRTQDGKAPIWPTWKTTALKNFGTVRVLSPLVVSSSLWPPWTVACQAPLSMEFSRQKYWCGLLFPSPVDLPNPEIEPRSPALQVDSEPLGKPKNTGVGNLSLLRGIFPTQESNRGLLLCRRILYQLSYQLSFYLTGMKIEAASLK